MPRGHKGEPRTPGSGRKKGEPNKQTAELKELLMQPFDPKKFAAWAQENPGQYFTQIVTKLLPKDIVADVSGSLTLQHMLSGRTIDELISIAVAGRGTGGDQGE